MRVPDDGCRCQDFPVRSVGEILRPVHLHPSSPRRAGPAPPAPARIAFRGTRRVTRHASHAFSKAVGFVIVLYVLVSLVTLGNLPVTGIVAARNYALFEAARSFFGQAGFNLISVAAMRKAIVVTHATALPIGARIVHAAMNGGPSRSEEDAKAN